MIRTFVDSGVLIAAARSAGLLATPALAVLGDANREFLASEFVRLEVLPKPTYHKRTAELAIYSAFFAAVRQWATIDLALVQRALALAEQYGLGAMDALHVAAAERTGADEVVTGERPDKPICRVTTVRVVSIQP